MPITDAHGVKRGEENVFRRKKISEKELARDSASTLPWQKEWPRVCRRRGEFQVLSRRLSMRVSGALAASGRELGRIVIAS